MYSIMVALGTAALRRVWIGPSQPLVGRRRFSSLGAGFSGVFEPPDLPRLADAARISLTAQEIEDFAPKINQVIEWFGQLQAVDLGSVEPSLRADDSECAIPREDEPMEFENREGMLAALPSYEEPYIKVPRVLTKDQ